jgi:hypothetical protein
MLESLIRAAVSNLQEFYRITADVSHPGEKGGFREYFVNQLIRPFIPQHFGISSGIVMDHRGRQSSQADVIIYDNRLMPPILQAEGRGIYPVECVLLVIEVKSVLRSNHFSDIVLASARIAPETLSNRTINQHGMYIRTRARTPDGVVPYPMYSVFAYESDVPERDEFERLQEQAGAAPHFVKTICVLNKGTWSQNDEGGISRHVSGDQYVNIRDFLVKNLDGLEQTAAMRGLFELGGWVGLSEEFMNR